MGKKLVNVLEHPDVLAIMSEKARENCGVTTQFLESLMVNKMRFWPEDFDSICAALKECGLPSGGFYIGKIRAVRYSEERA